MWLLILASVLALITALIANGDVAGEKRLTEAARVLLGWLEPVWIVLYNAATLLTIALMILSLLRRRWALARDIGIAVALTVGAGYLLALWIGDVAPHLDHLFWGASAPQYPEFRVAILTAVSLVAGPSLTRPFRRLGRYMLAGVAIASVVLGSAYASYLVGGFAIGLWAAAIVRLAFGSTAGFPTAGRVRAGLDELSIPVDGLQVAGQPPAGSVVYAGDGPDGRVAVTVYGRDARDTQVIARLWRGLWYRDAGIASVSLRELVEHEALMLSLAADAGVSVPRVVTVGMISTGDALLVTEAPPWQGLDSLPAEQITNDLIDRVWKIAATMNSKRIAHGALNVHTFRVLDDRVDVVGWTRGRLSAPTEQLSMDIAELLVSCTMLVGEERTLLAAEVALGRERLADALPYLQRAALTPAFRDEVKDRDVDIKSLRTNVAERVGEEITEVADLRRVSIRDVVLLMLVAIAAYAVITQIADVGLDTIIDELQDAQWAWVVFGFLILQLTFVCEAYTSMAAVGRPLPFGPTVLLQSAIKFIGLTVPSAAGRVALTTRYLTRQAVPTPVALTQGAIDSLAGFAVQLMILLCVLPFLDLNLNLNDVDVGPMIKAGVIILIVGVIVGIAFLVVPALRRKVQPFITAAWHNLKLLMSSPKRLVQIIVGNFLDQLLYAIAMSASLRAVGAEASVGELLVVNTLSSLLSGLVPVPGGIGVSEFVIASGFIAVGVPPAQAYAATLIYRVISFYLPPIGGFMSLKWLSKRGFV